MRHALLSVLLMTVPAVAQPAQSKPAEPQLSALREKANPLMSKGLKFLENAQAADGGWKAWGHSDPAITSLVAKAFIQHPDYGPQCSIAKRAVAFVLKYQQPDGGIYNPQVGYANYSTSVALMMLGVTHDPSLARSIKAAQDYLNDNQWDEDKDDKYGRKVEPAHVYYGGAGYGSGSSRPDLSNTQMMLEALHESGMAPDDPTYKKALVFISRCQMLSETNDQAFAQGSRDGGFIYSPANKGESKAGTIRLEKKDILRSYGSMTYSGFKSMLYASVDRQDPRVQAAWDWIRKYYTLDQNPNMPDKQSKEGLFYFYHVFSKALRAWGEPQITDAKGAAHDWREDLINKLAQLQAQDGSWVNAADRFMEDNPYLVTAYSILALQEAVSEASPAPSK